MKILLIGSGKAATLLGKIFRQRGHEIVFVYSRKRKHAEALGKVLSAKWGNSLDAIKKIHADVYIIAVKDDAIADVVRKMPEKMSPVVVHTSGAAPLSALQKKFPHCGVLWPAQTLGGYKDEFQVSVAHIQYPNIPYPIPVIIEASDSVSERTLRKLAGCISKDIFYFSSEQRKILHLAAVWVNNFTNHLYAVAGDILKEHKLPFEILAPLILATAQRGAKNPFQAQTGPAKRNDKKTMRTHLNIMKNRHYRKLYKLLSKNIQVSGF